MQSRFPKLTHANKNTDIHIDIHQVFTAWFSLHHKATLVMADAGAMLPVKESAEEVMKLKEAYIKEVSANE